MIGFLDPNRGRVVAKKPLPPQGTIAPRPTVLPYYDTSRIPDMDKLKVVQPGTETTQETERGEIFVNNGSELGPGANGPFIPEIEIAPKPGLTPTQLIMGAVALYFMFN